MAEARVPMLPISRVRAVAAYTGLFLVQAAYSVFLATVINLPQERLWPYVVGSFAMTVALVALTWQRERRIKLVAISATIAALVFVFLTAVLASFADASGSIGDAFFYVLYMFRVTGDVWVSFILCMVAAAIATHARPSNPRYPGRA